jgi:TonB family protein
MSRLRTLVVVLFATAGLSAQTTPAPPVTPAAPIQTPVPAPAETTPLPDSVHVVIKKRYPAIYSLEAEEKKLHGTVILSVLFNEAGAEENAEVTSGDPVLAQCALESVSRWQIASFIKDGKPGRVKVPLTFEFIYDDPPVSFNTGENSPHPPDGTQVLIAHDDIAHDDAPARPSQEAPLQPVDPAAQRVSIASRFASLELAKKRVPPQYPAKAKAAHIQGTVTFDAVVGTDGAIHELYTVSGDPLLAKAAEDAVRQWRYKQYIFHEHPVAFDIRIPVIFTLSY